MKHSSNSWAQNAWSTAAIFGHRMHGAQQQYLGTECMEHSSNNWAQNAWSTAAIFGHRMHASCLSNAFSSILVEAEPSQAWALAVWIIFWQSWHYNYHHLWRCPLLNQQVMGHPKIITQLDKCTCLHCKRNTHFVVHGQYYPTTQG